MKTIYAIAFLLLSSVFLNAQKIAPQNINKVAPSDTIVPAKGKPEEQLKGIDKFAQVAPAASFAAGRDDCGPRFESRRAGSARVSARSIHSVSHGRDHSLS